MLVRLQRDRDIEAWGYDLYSTAKFAELYCSREIPGGTFDLITCIEVLEHTTNPVEVLASFRSRIKENGLVVVSTELVDLQTEPKDWHYLAKEHGQHITLFSRSGLSSAAEASGFEWVRTLPFGNTPLLHLLVPKGSRIPARKLWGLRLRQWVGEGNHDSDRRV
jgi:hypothetical protein